MATRRPTPHLVKKRFSYTIAEIAALQSVHRNTVRAWLKEGLPTISDNCRPILILGHDLADFLSKRRTRNKRACQPGQLYCLACRQPREPAGAMVDLTIQTPTRGMLAGICPVCDRFMHRAVNPMRVRENCANLTVIETAATAHIAEMSKPVVNCHLLTAANVSLSDVGQSLDQAGAPKHSEEPTLPQLNLEEAHQ